MIKMSYTLPQSELKILNSIVSDCIAKDKKAFDLNPDRYCNKDVDSLIVIWTKNAVVTALFSQFKIDGLVEILSVDDYDYSFKDWAGDSFCSVTNFDMTRQELKRQERNARQRFNKQGAKRMELSILGEYFDCIGGFVGNDFYGSGYDIDFYLTAQSEIREKMPDYYQNLHDIFLSQYLTVSE